MSHIGGRRAYSRAEYLSDAAIHGIGIAFAIVAGPILVTLTALRIGDFSTVASIAIYSAALLAMLTASGIYNIVQRPHLADRLRRIDQSAIYLKIAGTYTPFFVLFPGSPGFLAGVWAAAIAGASIVIFSARKRTLLAIALYIGIGWAGLVWGQPLFSDLTQAAKILLLIGGLLYTGGVGFLLWYRLPFHNTIWHVFVLAATCICYAAIVVEVLAANPATSGV